MEAVPLRCGINKLTMRPITLLFAALLSLNLPALAQSDASPGTPASTASLVSENKTIAPGETFSVALELAHPDEWHSYYKNSGGVEESPVIKWTLPAGFTAGPIQWPVPEVKDGYFGKSFVYQGKPVFLVDITAPASLAAGGTATLTADATWQICKDSCLNEKGSLNLTLTVAATSGKDPATAALFKSARMEQAVRIPTLKFEAMSDGGDVTLRVEPADATKGTPTDFIPDVPFLQPASADGKIERDGDAWKVTLKRKKLDPLDSPIPQGKSFSGILAGPVSVEIPDTVIGNPPAKALAISKYLPLLGAMMLGGLILNLMPCVFPVIGLKIMGFVQQAGSDRKKDRAARTHVHRGRPRFVCSDQRDPVRGALLRI